MKKKLIREIVVGIVNKNRRGFGFIKAEDGSKDIFIAKSNMAGAMNGDLVEVDILPPHLWSKSKEGIVAKILERNTKEVVGTFDKNKRFGFVIPDDKKNVDDVFVKKEFFKNAQSGDKVLVKITKYPNKKDKAVGKILEVVANKNDDNKDILSLIRGYGLRESFPSRVNAEAKARSREPISDVEIGKRHDLRGWKVITIDGPDAKDLDDGVSIEKMDNGNYLLGVHIADVSHYVDEDGYLDKEALDRGTSVYLINQVIPMLPKALSNGACSLNANEDKLTLSCIMEVNSEGEVVSHSIEETIISSKARMVYDDASDILEESGDYKKLKEKYKELCQEIYIMGELARILRNKREKMGSIDFEIEEGEILLDEKGKAVDIVVRERRTANKLIEEFMLLANETVAEQFFWLELPFIYRVHERPDSEKLDELKAFLLNFNIRLKGGVENIYPRTIADILGNLKGMEYEDVVNRVILRSMKKAFYSPECQGHFGLAFNYYCHFTSPIRRYPDLFIHRMIKKFLRGELKKNVLALYADKAEIAADISSKTERKAQELEREVDKFKKIEYMTKHIGEEFDGIVSGVTEFGVYVELKNTVEGMAFRKHLRRDYSLGEKVKIRVIDAKVEERQLDFKILEK